MSFINEYISEEDIREYDVKESWRKISPGFGGKDYFPSYFTWTVDKERKIYFIPMSTGKEEFSNQKLCALWWKGTLLSVTLDVFFPADNTIRWELKRIWKPEDFVASDEEIKACLKDALLVYGVRGVYKQAPDFTVVFGF